MKNKELIVNIFRVILGLVFIFSAISKLVAPGLFEITILDQGIITTRETAAYLGRFLITMELFLGIALLQPYYLKQIILPAALLTLVGFTGLLLYSLFSGDTENCGCFGNVLKMSPLEAIIKNVILLFIGGIIYRFEKPKSRNIYIPFTILLISCGAVFIEAPIKTYEDLAFSKYTNFENEGRVDLTNGDNLVALFFVDCEHCMATAEEIVKIESETAKLPNFYILFSGEESDSVKEFLDKTKINHAYLRIPLEDFFGLVGNAPPRIYWLHDGKVKEYWDNAFKANIMRYQKEILE